MAHHRGEGFVSWDPPLGVALNAMADDMVDAFKNAGRTAIRSLVAYTPVKTGQLRGGWIAAINGDPAFQRPPDDKLGVVTIAFADAVIEGYRLGDELRIVNFTPHGIFVNDGTSRIEPRRMVERAIDDVLASFG